MFFFVSVVEKLVIVTGRGLHSKDGISEVKEAVSSSEAFHELMGTCNVTRLSYECAFVARALRNSISLSVSVCPKLLGFVFIFP